jgi:hypothetical protein
MAGTYHRNPATSRAFCNSEDTETLAAVCRAASTAEGTNSSSVQCTMSSIRPPNFRISTLPDSNWLSTENVCIMLVTILAAGSFAGVEGWTIHIQRERRVANNGIPPSRISSSPFNKEDAHLTEHYNKNMRYNNNNNQAF